MGFVNIALDRGAAPRARVTQLVALLVSVVLVSGCATNKFAAEQAENSLRTALADADSKVAIGQQDKALEILDQATKDDPASAAPWLKIANIRFDAANYPSSIVAANEVLKRDAENQEAKSILVVAGLRIAAAAVTDLRSTEKVNTGSRVEAENLTKALRRVLGETVLVPAPLVAEQKPQSRPGHPAHPTRPRVRWHHAPHPAPPQAAPTHAAPDPFAALK